MTLEKEKGEGSEIPRSRDELNESSGNGLRVTRQNGNGLPASSGGEVKGVVLYVEDVHVNVLLVQALLEQWPDVKFVSAADVSSGLELALEHRPDVVLLDIWLGKESGLDFIRLARAREELRDVRIVALSASVMPHEVDEVRRAGVLDFWTKPLDIMRFKRDMHRLLSQPRPGANP